MAGIDNTVQAPMGSIDQQVTQLSSDASESKKPFTVTASLREIYDDNINTANVNKQGSFETDISPSFLVDYPMENSNFSARYTFDGTYYNNRPGSEFDTAHEFVARYNHSFSDRYNLDLRDDFRYTTEPNFIDGTGTLFRQGAYVANAAAAEFTAQWTPLIGSVSSYTNNLTAYQDASVAAEQNSFENIGTHDLRFAILPKINLVFGGIIDDITYNGVPRGYTSYTGNAGIDWQALPSLTVNWQLGKRSSLAFNYSHSVAPTDVVYASGQEADRFTARFNYDITPSVTVHLGGVYTYSSYNGQLLAPGTISSFTENDAALDTGVAYHISGNFDVDGGYTFTEVSSGLSFRDYTRNQFSMGIRGTY